MKGLIITHKGAEKYSVDEILELSQVKIISVGNGFILFECNQIDELNQFAYKGQSFLKVLELIDDFVSENILHDLNVKSSFIKLEGSFKVKCTREGDHDFMSTDIEKKIGESILKSNSNLSVELDYPDNIIHIYILEKKCYICKEISKYDLSKRDYKIFVHPSSIKGTLAYLMLKVANYNKKGILVDPFCGSGTIPIEAALYANNISVHYFSKNKFNFEIDKKEKIKIINKKIYGYDFLLKNVLAARKNAKIASVDEAINFSKIDVSWLDSKFEKNKIDFIVTNPPKLSKNLPEKNFIKIMDELFYQSLYLLSDKGNLVLLLNSKSLKIAEENANKHNFILENSISLDVGSEDLNIVKFIKK